jgi:MATE family multidrug resistance protein
LEIGVQPVASGSYLGLLVVPMASQRKLFVAELRTTLALAVPMMIGQFGQMLMGITDTLVLGRVGVVPLAAVGFSNTLLGTLYVAGIGLLTSIGIFAAQAHGAQLEKEKVEVMRSALWLSLLAGTSAAALIWLLLPVLRIFGQPIAIETAARPYLAIVGLSLIPALGSMAAKTFCEALGKPVIPTAILYVGVTLNLLLNLPLVFGWMGIPALGLLGSAIATFWSRVFVLIGTVAYALFLSRLKWSALAPSRVDWLKVGALFRVGLPIGCQYLAEVGAFGFGAVMMGWIGTVPLASHQVVLTCAATSFMFPLGVSIAAAVRIGHAVGSGAHDALRRIANGAILISTAVATGFCILYLLAGHQITGLFTSEKEVVLLATRLMIVAGIFQIADGIQVTAAGCLRGLADVRLPMLIGIFCYWAVAIPTAFVVAFTAQKGAIGVWIGLATGLFVAATLLTWRLLAVTRPGVQDRFVFSERETVEPS